MRLKIGIIGPSEAGKTSLVNLLGNETGIESLGSLNPVYRPTDSVRIVEMTMPNVELKKYNTELEIQLWEVGGNSKLKSIWPAVQRDLDGVIIVYNVHNDMHIKDSSALHMHFVTHSPDGFVQCFIIGNIFRGMRDIGPQRILGVSKRVRHIAVNIEDDASTKTLMDEFFLFITGVAQAVHDREKSNLVGAMKSESHFPRTKTRTKSKKLTDTDRRNECMAMAQSKQKRSTSSALVLDNSWMRGSTGRKNRSQHM